MTRPITLVYQELATQTPTIVEPDLDCIVVGPAYQIMDYLDDKADLEVASYGELNADNPYVSPVANVPAITLAAPPGIAVGGWVVPASIGVVFDDLRVILADGTDGSVTINDNLLTSVGATFVTDALQAGDVLIIDDPVGPATPNLTLTVLSVVSETTLRVSSNFLATTASLKYRVERTLQDTTIASEFVVPPTFTSSNEIVILGGITVPVALVDRVVSYARVYVEYLAYRTDLQNKDSVTGTAEIEAKLGKIDARNPLAAHTSVAKLNAGDAPIYFYGIETDDILGYAKARDALSSDKVLYAEVLCTSDLPTHALFKADNTSLADPTVAASTGVPQKFRASMASETLPVTADIVTERATMTTEPVAGAIPPLVKRISFVSGVNFLTSNVKPGDQLVLTASENVAPIDGTYVIAHINSALEVELDTALPTTITVDEGVNLRVFRPSTNSDQIALVEGRAELTVGAVRYQSRVAGVTPGTMRSIALVENATTPDGIHSIVEIAGTTTVINANFAGPGDITAAMIVAAMTTGAGVTVPFTGSVNLLATTASGATVQVAAPAAFLSTGVAGVDRLDATAALDAAFLRVFDSSATFISDGVLPGDIVEIPSNPNGVFSTSTKQFIVNEVLSEQRLQIQNIVSGSYVNNTSTVENELPHLDNRLGTGTLVSQGTIRFKVLRRLSKDQQVESLAAMAQSLRSQRALLAWPDSVLVTGLVDGSKTRNADGTAAAADAQPGTYLAAVIGGMTAGLPNHQGFSNIGVAGIDRIYHSTGYFTERQLSLLSDSGWYVFAQDTPESLPYSIHQLTTDPSALQTGEYSMVKNFDYLARFFVAILRGFTGPWNVNEDTLGFIQQALNSGILLLKSKRVARIGAPINEATILSIGVSDASADRVEIYMGLDRPTPLNTIGLHLIG